MWITNLELYVKYFVTIVVNIFVFIGYQLFSPKVPINLKKYFLFKYFINPVYFAHIFIIIEYENQSRRNQYQFL